MGYGSIVSIFDRLSVKTVLTNSTGSYIGFLTTLAFIAVCLIILIPPVNQYFTGAYFQSQFITYKYPKAIYDIGGDVIIAMVFKNKKTGQLANHTDILQNLNSYGYYVGKQSVYKSQLIGCKPSVFLNAINPMTITDCIMFPPNLQYDITPVSRSIPYLQSSLTFKCDDVFKCAPNSPYYNLTIKYITQLANNYYYQYIFNSKVIDQKGKRTNQFHKIYSTQYNSPDGLAAYTQVQMAQKKYFVDDSILPWWNNRTYTNVFWTGKVFGIDGGQAYLQAYGYSNDYYVFTDFHYSYRYYKKLDFLLGMIGGAVFLLYLFFWVPCSFLNRTIQKMKNTQELLVQKKGESITTQQDFNKITIPWYYIFTQFLPGSILNKKVQQSQHFIDIVKIVKKLKVTYRNLRTKGLDLTFKSKDIDLISNQPQQYIPDRPALQSFQLSHEAYRAIKDSQNLTKVYQNNLAAMTFNQPTQANKQKIDRLMADQIYEQVRPYAKYTTFKQKFTHYLSQFIKYWDIFGARPMLNAEPQSSSCWGFFLTLVIIVLSVLTFALTIKNMDSTKIITSLKYQKPLDHNYQMTTSQNFRIAFCVFSSAIQAIAGANKTVQITFYKQSKKNGYQQLVIQKMNEGDFTDYFQLDQQDPFNGVPSQNCYRPSDGQKIKMSGSYQTVNQAYFGVRLDPYCSGTPSQCAARKNQTIADFLKFINFNTYGVYLSQNKYSPEKGHIVSGIASNQVSQSDYVMNASLLRTQTFYVSAVQLLDDTSKSFLRTPPKSLVKTMAFQSSLDRNQQRKGNPTADPGYILEFRPNGQVQQIIKRSYKIDFLLGLIGGIFVFWHFFVHFFAKFYNSYKIRAKLAQVLHQQDGYDQSMFVHFLYLIKFPSSICCFSGLRQDLERVAMIDDKMQRQLDYLHFIKTVDNCYRLSSALFEDLLYKDLSLIYFRQKIDDSQQVKPKRITQVKKEQFQDDSFLQFDEQVNDHIEITSHNGTSNLLPETSAHKIDLQKIVNVNRSKQQVPLWDPYIPNKKQHHLTKWIKKLDAFKNPPQFTLDGKRQIKSYFGAIMFFILAALVIIIVYYFLQIYTSGSDYTVSQRRLVDSNLQSIDSTTLGQLTPGIHLTSGKNFKFAVSFNKKDRYYPHNVTQYIGPIGVRMLKYTVNKANGQINQSYQEIQFQPCSQTYLNGFLSPYNDPQAFANLTLGYCLPDGNTLSLQGIPQDNINTYFKLNIYNKYQNSTGKAYLNSFFKIYLVSYYMSVPRMDIFSKDFQYQMIKFNYLTDAYSIPFQQNITLTKTIFTNKYYSRSRQTYNDKIPKSDQRVDVNQLSDESARNISFYYSGLIDHHTLDYPGGGQLFGLVGGVIALFVFVIYSCVSSFNQYRLKYLIGQRLYTFDKSLSGLKLEKGKKINTKKIQQMTKKINNFNQLQLLWAWILNPIGYIRDNYNFDKTLRRVTIIIDKVQNDINLYNVYKNLLTFKDQLDKKIKLISPQGQQHGVKLTSVYFKHIYNPEPIQYSLPVISKQSKKHKLSSSQQWAIGKVLQNKDNKINPRDIIGSKVLNRAFGLDDQTSVIRSRLMNEQEISSQHIDDSIMEQSQIKDDKKKKKGKKNQRNEKKKVDSSSGKFNQQQLNDQSKDVTANIQSFEIQQPRDEQI